MSDLDLRDQFAVAALPVTLSCMQLAMAGGMDPPEDGKANEAIAEIAYQLADAMLAQRAKGRNGK